MAEEKMVTVRNRNVGGTGYGLDNGFHRQFEPGEVKKIPLEELKQLSYAPGGEYILKNCLMIDDKSALEVLNMEVEPEYFYTDADIKKLLLEGTLDQLEDTLNFAPGGVIEILKKTAVELEIPDVRKRKLISEKTGFNIDSAIQVNTIMAEEEEVKEEAPKRKSTPISAPAIERKATPIADDKYKVVIKK